MRIEKEVKIVEMDTPVQDAVEVEVDDDIEIIEMEDALDLFI